MLVRLTRVRLSLLVTFSAMTGYLLTGNPPKVSFLMLLAGVFLLSAGTSVFNQVQEYRNDALMKRTKLRPIPAGDISCLQASWFAIGLILFGASFLAFNGWLPMVFGLSNIVFYNLIYTPLKTRSYLAIIPGAIVGAVPPLIGWTSVGFNPLHPNILFLASFVFLWQVPHFWLLMIKYGKEYEEAGFSTISKVLNDDQIKSVVFVWGVVTSLFLLLFPFFGFTPKPMLFIIVVIQNIVFIVLFYRFLFLDKNPKTVSSAFILINSYALLVFIILIINSLAL